jgi:hypothetical protein
MISVTTFVVINSVCLGKNIFPLLKVIAPDPYLKDSGASKIIAVYQIT